MPPIPPNLGEPFQQPWIFFMCFTWGPQNMAFFQTNPPRPRALRIRCDRPEKDIIGEQ